MSNILIPEQVSLLNHPEITEKNIQEKIAENPAILNLGNLVFKDKERPQSGAGRLDLLLQDEDSNRRYEVEIQLGKTDESHIIRTIEYWDTERKRYPQYDHCAVIIAEDITSRFLNVISLFHGSIPLIAIKMSAFKMTDGIAITFTTVLDELTLGLVDEDEQTQEVTDRNYWINRGTEQTVQMADELLNIISKVSPGFQLKYTKFYIGLAKDGSPNNFVVMRPRKGAINIELRLPYAEEIQDSIDKAGLDDVGYHKRSERFRIRLPIGEIKKDEEILKDLFTKAFEYSK